MLLTWSNEQAIREIYLRPFDMAVKQGGTHSVMTSYNYIGNQWAGACGALLNGVLREEWGFTGVTASWLPSQKKDGAHDLFYGPVSDDRAPDWKNRQFAKRDDTLHLRLGRVLPEASLLFFHRSFSGPSRP
ncbi:MAG: hypothetical protein IKP32_10625 [Clostridia bacterium]|nr:hypothetical protein [Clostridia bacterium]